MGWLRTQGRTASTVNKYINLIKALDRWLVQKAYRTAPTLSGESAILRRTKPTRRDRRLQPDTIVNGKVMREGEERRLIRAATPWLQRLIIAAIETGCRRGELLNLRWADVDLNVTRGEIVIRAATNKTGEGRHIPISPKLRAVLEMLRLDPKGKERPGDHYVFGNAVGEPVASSKKAWETTVLKAHGYEPVWTDKNGLARQSRQQLQTIDLHFHDLRHEAGSRLLESGWVLSQVQKMLGHADVKQTATYLNADTAGLHDAMKRYGTTPPWQSVAIDVPVEQQTAGHDDTASAPQPTIN